MRQAWSGQRAEQTALALVVAAAALLLLDAAATVHAVYTIRLSYFCAAGAVVVGAPFVLAGARRLPPVVRGAALALLVVYVLAAVLGHQLALPGDSRTGGVRSVVYVLDLALGLACFALVPAVFRTRERLRLLGWAFVAGGAAAAAFAVYQWVGQRYGLPLTNLNNTLDSNGITTGANQGPGVFGWTRARGTFLEPHFLGDYIASILPLATGAALLAGGRLRAFAAATAVALGLALIATSSAPDFAVLAVGVLLASTALTIGRGQVTVATALGFLTATMVVLTPLALLSPAPVAAATGRSEADVANTILFRTDTWSRAVEIWRQRPVLGFGPGQSSVQLAAATDVPPALRPPEPGSLQSAQGVWAASLVDAGIAGLVCWIVLLVSVVWIVLRAVARAPSAATWAVAAAAVAGAAGAQVTGDRLDLRVWLLFGFALAVANTQRENRTDDPAGRDEQAAERADHEPGRP
jgi:O-antigen ligase